MARLAEQPAVRRSGGHENRRRRQRSGPRRRDRVRQPRAVRHAARRHHARRLAPRKFFNRWRPTAGPFILGATFTLIFVDEDLTRPTSTTTAAPIPPCANLLQPRLRVERRPGAAARRRHRQRRDPRSRPRLRTRPLRQGVRRQQQPPEVRAARVMNAVYISPFTTMPAPTTPRIARSGRAASSPRASTNPAVARRRRA